MSVQSVDFRYFKDRLHRFLPNVQAVSLAVILIVNFALVYCLADLLMPVFASVVIAYLLEGVINKLENLHLPRFMAVYLVFCGFMAALGVLLFYLLPLVSEQAVSLVQLTPDIIDRIQNAFMHLPDKYPQYFSERKLQAMLFNVQKELLNYGQGILSVSAASVVGLVSALVYLFLVPMMVFFFLKDKQVLISWFLKFLPKDRHLAARVWEEIELQIRNYIRGKFAEVLILAVASYAAFEALGLNYAMLLAVLMGLQAIIPYVGATLVTFPVLGIAYFQWGFTGDNFMYVLIAYSVIQALDGVVLVPILFSEAVNLHAVAIIIAILFFGGLWGFWGVFLAIPLATVVKAVLNAWPQIEDHVYELN